MNFVWEERVLIERKSFVSFFFLFIYLFFYFILLLIQFRASAITMESILFFPREIFPIAFSWIIAGQIFPASRAWSYASLIRRHAFSITTPPTWLLYFIILMYSSYYTTFSNLFLAKKWRNFEYFHYSICLGNGNITILFNWVIKNKK